MLNYADAFADAIGQAAIVGCGAGGCGLYHLAGRFGGGHGAYPDLQPVPVETQWDVGVIPLRGARRGAGDRDGCAVDGRDVALRHGRGHAGRASTSVGWALFQIFIIMSANVSQRLVTGEWKPPRQRLAGCCGGDFRYWPWRPW